MGGDGGTEFSLTGRKSNLLQKQMLQSWKEWQTVGALQAATFFCYLPQYFFVLFLDLLPLHVFQLFLIGGCCYRSVDVLLEMLYKFTDCLRAVDFHCPWHSCRVNQPLFATKFKIYGNRYLK